MIKHLFTTLCALALITAGSIPALAAEADTSESARYYPISVEEYTYEEQNEPRINKVYQLIRNPRCSTKPCATISRCTVRG